MKTRQQIADEWSGKACTLDGKPAKVMGRKNPFATVAILPDGYHCEFTWGQVDNVMVFGGRFMSGLSEVKELRCPENDVVDTRIEGYDGGEYPKQNLSCFI